MGLQLGGGHGDGDGRGTTLRLSAGGGGLPPGILGPGDTLHDGEGAGGIYAQPRRDVQPPHQVWCLRREAGPRLRPHRHGPLCADGVDRRAQMAHDESRPREGPDRFPGSDTPMATEEGALPHRPLHEGRGEAGRRARASDHARRKDSQGICFLGNIDYNEYVGRIGVGKVDNGTIKVNQDCVLVNHHEPDKQRRVKISKLYEFDGLNKVEVKEATIGSIVAISGIADIHIGDTLCGGENPEAIPFQKISELPLP